MKSWLKILLVVVLVLGVLGGAAGLIVGIDKGKFDSKKVSDLAFSIGGLDSNGNYMDTDKSIYTKNAFECQGLNVTLDFDSKVTYAIYFYDQNNDFVHTTGKLEGAFVSDSIPFFAKYARIVATPIDDEKVSLLEVSKYAKNVNVSVYREQGFKNYTDNLFVAKYTDKKIDATGALAAETDSCVSDYINIVNYKDMLVFRALGNTDLSHVNFYCYNNSKTYLSTFVVSDKASVVFTTSEGLNYYGINMSNMPEGTNFLLAVTLTKFPVEIYCR